jgi:sulfite exporter TauE/SafE
MADAALAATALLMGLAGGPHCAAMCGAAQTGLSAPGGPRAVVALQLGRVAGYAAAGALVAASVSALAGWGSAAPVLRPLWSLLHVAAIALGGWLLWQGRAPVWLAQLGTRARDAGPPGTVRFHPRGATGLPWRPAMAGACWAAMPCGLLQSALIVAALATGPLQGAGVMAAFGLASAASLALVPWVWRRLALRRSALIRPTFAVRLAGALLVGSSVFALAHGLADEIDRAICATLSPA